MPIDIANECSVACRDVIQSTRQALACGVVALASGEVVSLHHVFPSLPRKEIQAIAEAVCEMFCGQRLRGLDRVLSRRLRDNAAFEPPSELYLDMPAAQMFLKSMHKHDMVAFLLARKSANQGFGWLTLRKVVSHLRKKVTERIHLESGAIPGLRRTRKPESRREPQAPMRRMVSHSATTFSGQLTQFGLSTVLQMLGQQKISGRLEVQGPGRVISIMLETGQIISSWEGDGAPGDGLVELLFRYLQLDEQTLRKVKRRSSFRGISLLETLREMGIIDERVLGKCVRSLILERVYTAFCWAQGSYNFFPDKATFDGVRCVPVDVEKTLFKTALMADEMPRLRAILPGEDTRIQAVSQVLALQLEPLHPRLQKVFHALPVGVSVPLAEARHRIPLANFETLKALVELHQRGYLYVDGTADAPSGPSRSQQEPEARPRRSASSSHHPRHRPDTDKPVRHSSGSHPRHVPERAVGRTVSSGHHPRHKPEGDKPQRPAADSVGDEPASRPSSGGGRRGGLVFTARPRTEERKVDLKAILGEEEAEEVSRPRTMTMRLKAIRAVKKSTPPGSGSGNGDTPAP